jgi:hypothetical protein
MCRCAERRAAIVGAGRSVLRGDVSRLAPAARFVVKTSGEDLAAAFRKIVGSISRSRP